MHRLSGGEPPSLPPAPRGPTEPGLAGADSSDSDYDIKRSSPKPGHAHGHGQRRVSSVGLALARRAAEPDPRRTADGPQGHLQACVGGGMAGRGGHGPVACRAQTFALALPVGAAAVVHGAAAAAGGGGGHGGGARGSCWLACQRGSLHQHCSQLQLDVESCAPPSRAVSPRNGDVAPCPLPPHTRKHTALTRARTPAAMGPPKPIILPPSSPMARPLPVMEVDVGQEELVERCAARRRAAASHERSQCFRGRESRDRRRVAAAPASSHVSDWGRHAAQK